MTPDQWKAYQNVAFETHQEYVGQLKRLAHKYPPEMLKKDKKGRTALQILMAGSSRSHFMYLQNGSIFVFLAGGNIILQGTTHNEAEHRTLKRWTECVYQQHRDRLEYVSELHGFYRMVGNSYKDLGLRGAKQLRENRAVSLVAGLVAAGGIKRPDIQLAAHQGEAPCDRDDLYRPLKKVDASLAAQQRLKRGLRRSAWGKQASQQEGSARKRTKRVQTDSQSLRCSIETALSQTSQE